VSILPELFRSAVSSAVHLEMRDAYQPDDPDWIDWREGRDFDPAERWHEWFSMVKDATARGVSVRRARIVSEPVTDYVRYEYDVTAKLNLASGEDVRWLPRSRAVGLLVPAVDFWIFDEAITVVNHFDGYGGNLRHERLDDAELAARYAAAFEGVWDRATPHREYVI
jgi:Family of unknown function (DUF6879)